MENRKQFTMYESIFKSLQRIRNKKDRADAYDAVCSYSLYGTVSNEQSKIIAHLIPELDKEIRESKEGRTSGKYKLWRRTVFERDDYTCQMCYRRGCRINAHHIKSYAYYPDLRYVINNGVTLCEVCHKAVHKKGCDLR